MPLLRRHAVLDARGPELVRDLSILFSRTEEFAPLDDVGSFHLTINSVLLDTLRLSAVASTGHRVVPIDDANVTLLVPWRGVLRTDDGRSAAEARPGDAILPRPGRRTTLVKGPYLGIVAQVPLQQLAGHAAANCEDRWRPDWNWHGISTAPLHRYLRYLVEDLDAAHTVLTSPRAAATAAMLFMDLMVECGTPCGSSTGRPQPSAGLWQVERAEAVIRARFHEPLSIAAVAGHLGVSTRALQQAFRDHRGTTPRAFLASCRLEATRERLRRAAPGDTVCDLAMECGISHLGRFAAEYRSRYGEAPSATLLRAIRLR